MTLLDSHGRPLVAEERAERADAWANPQTGLGVWGLDKTKAATYLPPWRVLDQELTSLYNGSDIAAKIVGKRPDEMFRRGYEIEADNVNASETDDVREWATEYLDLDTNMREGKRWGRLYGGALVVMIIDDGREQWEPLDEQNIRSFNSLSLVDRRYSYVQSQYAAMTGPKYGRPEIYLISNAVAGYGWNAHGAQKITPVAAKDLQQSGAQITLVHESRVIRFDGNPADVVTRQNLAGWSWSVLQRVYDAMRQFDGAFDSAGYLLSDASQGVFKLQGLMKAISTGQRAALATRLQMLEMSRSVMRGVALDAGGADGKNAEDFTRVQTPFGGIPELLDRMMHRMAAAADMPATELFGRAPAGMNATGESDTRKWYDTIETEQKNDLGPPMKRVYKLVSLAKNGPLRKRDVKWTVKFRPLWSPTDQEMAQTRLANAQRDEIYLTAGVVKPEEVAIDLFEVYPNLDIKAREQVLAAGVPFDPYANAPAPQLSTAIAGQTQGEPLSPKAPVPLVGTTGTAAKAGTLPAVQASGKASQGAAGADPGAKAPPVDGKPAGKPAPTAKVPDGLPPGKVDPDEAKPTATKSPDDKPGKDDEPKKQKTDATDVAAAYQERARLAARASQSADDGEATDGDAAAAHYSARAFARKAGDAAAVDLHTRKIGEHELREEQEHADAWDPDQARDERGRFATSSAVSASREATSLSGVAQMFGGADDHGHAAEGHAKAAGLLRKLSEKHAVLGNAKAAERHSALADHHAALSASHAAERAAQARPQTAGRKAAETRAQNDERALSNIPDHLHPLWHEWKSTLKGDPHTRAEKLMEFAEANPHEAINAMQASAERKLTGMIRRRVAADAAERVDAVVGVADVSVCIVWNKAGEVLCVSRPEPPHEMFCPGGHVEPGETFEETAIRELAEETGITITKTRDEGRLNAAADARLVHVFTALAWHGKPEAREASSEVAWMTPDALFKQSQVYRQAIIEMQRRCLLSGTTARPIVETDRADAMAAELLATLLVTRQDGKAAGSVFEQLLEDYPAKLLGWILAAHWSGPLKVPTAQIDSANRASWRASHEPIEPYAKRIEKNGDDAKPIILVKTPSGKIIIVDGHHRFLAFEQLGLPAIGYLAEVHVEKGPWDELHSSQKKGGDPDGSSSFLPSIDKSDAARDDFDPEQPRGEDGRFGEGSGEGTSSAPKAEASGDDDWQPPASAAPLFSAKSLQGLGRDAAQAHADPDKLFEDARQAHEAQLDLLNRGTGLDKDLGATAVRGDLMAPKAFDDAVTGAATATGPVVLIGPMKTRESAERKTRDENDGDWTKLSDVVRASVAVDSIDQLHEVVGHLQDRGMTLAKLPSDRFATPLESGYRDLNLKVAYPNGHIGEIQLHLKGVLAVKSALHKLYEVSRELEPKMAKRAMTQADWHTYDQAMRQQRKDYGDAWRKAGGT